MDYVVGSVAALVSGNVTPNRPKFLKRAMTPTKHQPSPNVTPKSELAEDRSIFLSPTLQKKKAIVKKSPKRIFQNPEVDVSNDGEGSQNSKSPKADKVKKHLKEDLEADANLISPKSPQNKNSKVKKMVSHNNTSIDNVLEDTSIKTEVHNESSPKKKKRNKSSISNDTTNHSIVVSNNILASSPKKVANFESNVDNNESKENNYKENDSGQEKNLPLPSPKKKRKKNLLKDVMTAEKSKLKKQEHISPSEDSENENDDKDNTDTKEHSENVKILKKSKRKNKTNTSKEIEKTEVVDQSKEIKDGNLKISRKKKKSEFVVNPNAISNKDTDSEHDSDDEIESENEQNNKEVLDTGPPEESSDEEEKVTSKKVNLQKNKNAEVKTEEEVKRTLFVGNVPFSVKCKKEIKKIFSKYGQIETVRIRTIPVKDGRVTPKVAVIKNELHPDRSTVNVYVKFKDASSIKEALAENGTVLNNCHLRVTPSDSTGSEHDPKCSIFIGNLPFALEDEALQEKFAQCGEIVSVRIIRDKKTNAGKGFGYVNFKSKDAVELALVLSEEELTIKNRILRVKRCTQATNKQRQQQDHSGKPQRGHDRRNMQGNFGRGHSQGNYGRGNSQGNYGRGISQGNYERGNSQRNYGRGNAQSRNQFGNREENKSISRPNNNDSKGDGAMRRLMNKRKNQDAGEGPPNKMQRGIKQPGKKTRKEFVGVTAEKKKKNKFNKGQKKKKALSEILTK